MDGNPLLAMMLLGLLAVALVADLRARRIPNGLVLVGLAVGTIGQCVQSGLPGLASAASGAAIGLACLLPFYIRGAMGAGDVKLMAMCGAFLGPLQIVVAAVASLLIGGLVGVAWFFWQYFSKPDEALPDDVACYLDPSATVTGQRSDSPVPYALAIFAGVFLVVIASPVADTAWGKGVL